MISEIPAQTKRLIYVIGTYPLLTTTFIDREIERLRQSGIDIQVIAMRRPDADTPFSEAQQALRQGVDYLLPVNGIQLLLSHCYFVLKRPVYYLRTLFYLLTRTHPTIKARFKTLLHFGEGVYAAYLLRNRPFRELHAHFVDRAATVALVAGRLLDKPYSLSVHAGADIFVDPVLLTEKIRSARRVATCTRFNIAHIESLIGQDLTDKVAHIYHGLELEKYHPVTVNGARRPLILAVGQLAERKGFHWLIQACQRLKERSYSFECRIIGRGPQQQALHDLITHLSLQDTVFLCGALPHDEVIDWYGQATCFVLPCIQSQDGNLDGIPNVLAEAMAMQLPVISTTVSAIPELIRHEVSGLLVPPKDDTALSAAIARLLDTPDLRQRLGRNARQHIVETFDVNKNVDQFATALWPEWMN
jgi:glycosyltransferase involved in cell wall biosynthesis